MALSQIQRKWIPLLVWHSRPMLVRFNVSWACSTSIASSHLNLLNWQSHCGTYWARRINGCGNKKDAFDQVKKELSKSPVLALYSPSLDTMISADAPSYGLGALLLQKHSEEWKWFPEHWQTEQRYAQIEKEALAVTWACECFEDYLLGIPFLIETDHEPLVSLIGNKSLDNLPPWILHFRLRLMRYN